MKSWLKDLARGLVGYYDLRRTLARIEDTLSAFLWRQADILETDRASRSRLEVAESTKCQPKGSNYSFAKRDVLRLRAMECQRSVLSRLVCAACLGNLERPRGGAELVCNECGGRYEIRDNVPIMLVMDPNWDKKRDEIDGEVAYNAGTVPPQVHEQRNSFMNQSSRDLLKSLDIELSRDDVLIVGCSMAEAECFEPLARSSVALDIVPELTLAYQKYSAEQGRNVAWICGDGECLPFPSETFDTVIVRQALHHMLKYYSAISEFFRVCRIGGRIIIIEEPYSEPDLADAALRELPDDFPVYGAICLGDLRRRLDLPSVASTGIGGREPIDFSRLEAIKAYIPAIAGDSESLLADKYHAFAAINLIFALRLHTDEFELLWPDRVAWVDHSGKEIVFCTGANPAVTQPLIERLAVATTLSVIARKTRETKLMRSRHDLKASTPDAVS
ncbi:MAG: methyltransferase domain-containing protein [Alphaproteobacteria bacterium]